MAFLPEQASAGNGHFSILEDAGHQLVDMPHGPVAQDSGVFTELAVENCQNQGRNTKRLSDISQICDQLSKLNVTDLAEPKSIKSSVLPQTHRFQRPSINQQTFEPLDSVQEESILSQNRSQTTAAAPVIAKSSPVHALDAAIVNPSLENEVKKHLSGQFEWLVSKLPAVDAYMDQNVSPTLPGTGDSIPLAYGCNLLLRKQRRPGHHGFSNRSTHTNSYILLATLLPEESLSTEQLQALQDTEGPVTMSWPQAPPPYQESKLRVPDVVEIVEHAVSPALSGASEHSGSFVMAPSPAGSCSLPRIEDSLEELDKLEEELEAIDAFTKFKQTTASAHTPKTVTTHSPSTAELSAAKLKRISMATMSSTVRAMSVEMASPSLRRSSSLTLRSRESKSPLQDSGNKVNGTPTRMPKASTAQSTAPKAQCGKVVRAPTVPRFDLPGEAVSRRLREQKEARQAQQEQAKAAASTPAKPRTLTKPAFELPGEAISRRKREEREAKLKAQEEEDRKRREFKARPMRTGNGAQVIPRETIASRARQAKLQLNSATPTTSGTTRSARPPASTVGAANKTTGSTSLHVPKRTAVSGVTGSGAVTGNTGNATKANTISAGTAPAKTLRRRSTMLEGLKDPKVREKQEKEEAIKVARKEAAERSRQASREWAEKQKRKGLAQGEK